MLYDENKWLIKLLKLLFNLIFLLNLYRIKLYGNKNTHRTASNLHLRTGNPNQIKKGEKIQYEIFTPCRQPSASTKIYYVLGGPGTDSQEVKRLYWTKSEFL